MNKISSDSMDRIQEVSIVSIAKDLGLRVKKNKCLCPFHGDKVPSMSLRPNVNKWKCFSCNKSGDNISLVMEKENLSFVDACKWIAERNNIYINYEDGDGVKPTTQFSARTQQVKSYENTMTTTNTLDYDFVNKCQGTNNSFCHAIVASGILTEEQMKHATEAYHLGCTNDNGVIFWQIDDKGKERDGKIMWYGTDCHRIQDRNPSWVSFRLKQQGEIPEDHDFTKCFFGLHLLQASHRDKHVVALVESEKTAIICSELIPALKGTPVTWIATGGKTNLSVEGLKPLVGYKVVIFPDTDTDGSTFKLWSGIASQAAKQYRQPFYVSPLLELHATPEQKKAKIDIADFIVQE